MVVCQRPGLARLPAKRGRASVETTANSARLRSFISILRWFSEEYTSELFHPARTGGRLDPERPGERGRLVAALHHHHDGSGGGRSIDLECGTDVVSRPLEIGDTVEAGIRDVEGGHAAGEAVAADAQVRRRTGVKRGGHGLQSNAVCSGRPGADPLRIQAHRSGAIDVEISVDAPVFDAKRAAAGELRRKRRHLRALPGAGKILEVERAIERLRVDAIGPRGNTLQGEIAVLVGKSGQIGRASCRERV